MIKSYKQWKAEQIQNVRQEDVYNAALREARKHYEEEHAATLEYAHSVMSRTSDITFDIAEEIVRLTDVVVPMLDNLGKFNGYQQIVNKLKELLTQHGENNE